jgi:pyrophosphatase PpaX
VNPETSPDTPAAEVTIQAALFDLDGTLIDTVGLILASMRHATREVLGFELPDSELMHGVGTPLSKQMEALAPDRRDELVAEYRRHNWDVHDELISEYAGVDDMLEEIAGRGVPMGVVTSKSRRVAIRGIELFGLERFFEVIVCSDDLDVHKPDPGPILHAADLLDVPAHECVYVGDSPYDVRAARAAGTHAVAVLWGVFGEDDVLEARPDYVLDRVEDVPCLLGAERDRFRVDARHAPAPKRAEMNG